MKNEDGSLSIRLVVDAREAARAIADCARRFGITLDDAPRRLLAAGVDWCADFDQEMRARNLVTVRALPCERD